MGSWVSGDLGYGWYLGSDDDEWKSPVINRYLEHSDRDEDDTDDVVEFICAHIHNTLLPDETDVPTWSLESRTGFSIEPQFVHDYNCGYLLVLNSRHVRFGDAVNENVSIPRLATPFTPEELSQLEKMADALELDLADASWMIGLSYG